MNKILNYIFEKEKSPGDTKKRFLLYFLLCYLIWLIDALTTILGVGFLGAIETNPIMAYLQNLWLLGWLLTYVFTFVGLALVFLFGYGTQSILEYHERTILLTGKCLVALFVGLEVYVVISNVGVIFSLI